MSNIERLHKGERIEVIDLQHEDFKKTGTIIEIGKRQFRDKPEGPEIIIVRVELDGSRKLVDFYSHPKSLATQIKKIPQ